MAKISKIVLQLNSDQLKAYKEFSEDKGKSLDKKLTETFRSLYEENVPEPVRRFVALDNESTEVARTPKRSQRVSKEAVQETKAPVIKSQSM